MQHRTRIACGWWWGIVLALVFFGARPGVASAEELVVVANGESAYAIIMANEAESRRIGEAAAFLQQTVERSTGVTLPILREADAEHSGPAIYLGRSHAAREAGIDVDAVSGWGYLHRVVGEDIFLVGEDREGRVGNSAGAYGSFKAVTEFLRTEAGVRFLLPGEFGTHVPRTDTLTVRQNLDVQWTPWLDYYVGRASGFYRRNREPYNRAFGFAHHMFGPSELFYGYGGHSYYFAVPEEVYGETNPEYFVESGGVRVTRGNHLCISNEEVQQLMVREMEKHLDAGYDWVLLAQTDGYIACLCEQCHALDPDIGERLWIVHRKLAEEIRRTRPGKKVVILSYANTNDPPKSFDAFPDNVVLQLTRYRPEDFQLWRDAGFGDVPKSLYTTNWLTMHPRMSPFTSVRQVRLFAENDVRGIYLCGGWTERAGGNWYPWGLGGPGYYAFSRALHDPGVDPAAMRTEFVEGAFGEAAAPMLKFFETLDDRMDHFWHLYRRTARNGPPTPMMGPGDFETHFYPPRTIRAMTGFLDRAVDLAQDEQVRARLQLVATEFDLLKHAAPVHHAYRTYQFSPSVETLTLIEEAVLAYREAVARVFPDRRRMRIEGLPSPFAGATAPRGIGSGAPFNWDFDHLREHGIFPGMYEAVRTEAVRVDPFPIDGRLDKAVWKDIPSASLTGGRMGIPDRASSFKIAYDDTHLYIGVHAEINAPEALDHVVPVGRDGAVWRQESIEVGLDPAARGRMYYHFGINPAENSLLDRRFGYHEDPEHPQYQDFDPFGTWNPDWEYAVHIDREALFWSAELKIPFATMEVDTPRPGDLWMMNLVRAEYPYEASRIYYFWSVGSDRPQFHNPSEFGELIFR